MDVVSWDNYPIFHNDWETLADTAYETAFQHALMRSLKRDVPFMMMESAPGLVNWQNVNKLKRPASIDWPASRQWPAALIPCSTSSGVREEALMSSSTAQWWIIWELMIQESSRKWRK